MAKTTKLLVNTRDKLYAFAAKNVKTQAETNQLDAAYARALRDMLPLVEKKYPSADMKILTKYEAARPVHTIILTTPDGRTANFDFRPDDRPPMPYTNNSLNYRLPITATATHIKLAANLARRKEAVVIARRETLAKYEALIRAARTAEELIEAWPASATVLEPFIAQRRASTALVAVSKEVRDFIKKDNAGA